MRRLRTWLLIVVGVVVVLFVVALIAVPRVVDTPRIQALIATTVSQSLGRPVKFSDVSIGILPLPSVVLKDLEVAEDPAFGQGAFLRLNEAVIRLRLWPLLFLRVELGDFILKRPMISLVQAPDGRWNFTTLGVHTEPRASGRTRSGGGGGSGVGAAGALGGRVKIEHGVVTYETRARGATAHYRVEDLDLAVTGGPQGALTFTGNVKVKPVWEAPRFMGRPVTGSVAGGSLTTNATVTLEQDIRVDLTELTIKGVAIEKVLVDFLCQGYAVTGPTDDTGTLGVRLADLWHTLNGQGQLRIGPGRVVGSQALALLGNLARVGGAVAAVLGGDLPNLGSSPVEYDSITASYTITNGVVTTPHFVLSGRSLKITAAGSYALASGALNPHVGLATGRAELKGKVTGTASAPSIRGAPPTALRDVDPAKVEKGLEDLLKRFR